MDALTLGPLMLPMPSLYLLFSVVLFFLGSALAGRSRWLSRIRHDLPNDLSHWSQRVFWGSLIAGRLGYAILNPEAYRDEPLQLLYVWQPGYSVNIGITAAAIYSLYFFRRQKQLQLFSLGWLLICVLIWWLLIVFQPLGQKKVRQLPPLTLAQLVSATPSTSTVNTLPQIVLNQQQKPVIINLWATWCAPCRREMPALVHFAQQHPDIQIWLVNQGESEEQIQRFIQQQEPEIPAHLILLDSNRQLMQYFDSPGLPMTLAFSNGHQRDLHIGELSTARLLTMKERLSP